MEQWFHQDRGIARGVFTLVALLVSSAACTIYLFHTYHERLAAVEDDQDGFHGVALRQLMRMREATHDLEKMHAAHVAAGVTESREWLRSSAVRASQHTCENALTRIEELHGARRPRTGPGSGPGRYGGAVSRVRSRLDVVRHGEGPLESLAESLAEVDFSLRQLERLHLAGHDELLANQPRIRRRYAIQLTAIGALVVILSGVLVASNIAAIRRIVRRRSEHQKRLQLLMLELDHRVKNTLATVLAIASRTEHSTSTSKEFHAAFTSRVSALVGVHESLANSRWKGAALPDLVARMIAPFQNDHRGRITVTGPDVLLRSNAAAVMGMILHELVTNAAKHGALSRDTGSVQIGWSRVDREDAPWLALEWQEHGGPHVAPTPESGFGTTFVRGATSYELQGEAEFSFAAEGLHCRVTFPLGEEGLGEEGEGLARESEASSASARRRNSAKGARAGIERKASDVLG